MRVLTAVAVIAVVLLVVPSAEAVPPGTFTRMFPKLAPFDTPTDQQLADLAQTMRDTGGESTDNLRVPAGITFLGQFIDHDLTLDTEPSPIAPVNIRHLDNDRNGNFDLDSVYGDGPSRTPELYEADKRHLRTGVSNGIPDVPRRAADGSAILGDGRNDENLIVVQLHAAFLRFHNRLVDEGHSFQEAQRLTRYHYQWIVVHEYLPDIVGQETVDRVLRAGNEFYKPGNKHDPVLPIEFSVAAFRFGHSEVRPGYALNAATGRPIFSSSGPDLRGGRAIPAGHGIEWQRFFAVDGSTIRPAPSKLIDTKISQGLFELPIPGAAPSGSNVPGLPQHGARQVLRAAQWAGRRAGDGRADAPRRAGARFRERNAAVVLHPARIRAASGRRTPRAGRRAHRRRGLPHQSPARSRLLPQRGSGL